MSLTQRIKSEASQEYQASDGTIYLLQRVDLNELFVSEGLLPDLSKMLLDEQRDGKPLSEEEAQKLAMEQVLTNPGLAARGLRTERQVLERGLIGERSPDGGIVIYRHVDKPAILLGEGEVNVNLIPIELRTELANVIMAMNPKPKVGGERFRAVSGQPAAGAAG